MSERSPEATELTRLRPRRLNSDCFVEGSPRFDDGLPSMFGGHAIAHALWSAILTVDGEGRHPHVMHVTFVRAAAPERSLVAVVGRVKDGRSFALREVTVRQDDVTVLLATVSFHADEPGESWPAPDPSVGAAPGTAPAAGMEGSPLSPPLNGFDVRPMRGVSEGQWPRHPFWIKARGEVGNDPALHAAALAYISDMGLAWTSRALGTGKLAGFQLASLDHGLWIHRRPRVDRWLKFEASPLVNHGARGLVQGALLDELGDIVATVMQETLIRPPSRC